MKKYKIIISIVLLLTSAILKAAEKDLYDFLWLDPDKKVFVLQNKVHKKEHTVYANFGYGSGLSSNFQDTTLMNFNGGYYLTETWAIEGLYTSYSNSDNDAFTNLKRINGVVPFIRNTKSNYGVLAKWSPFYGKINTFNKIFYFDWSFGAGIGQINTESNATTVGSSTVKTDTFINESYTTVISKTELTLHFNKNIHLNLGLLFNTYYAPGPTIKGVTPNSKLRNNIDAIVGVGFSY
jgi:outer membrane beta-barrel protein